ncbi:MAG: hypothetical protein E7620_07000 [Ruminococcaceae bacterium]|nr:hypothetical protein [Oscillospiraceae bacterium]
MKKILTLLLVLCMMLPLAACGNDGNTPAVTTGGNGSSGGNPTDEPSYLDQLPVRDYDLEEFHVLCTSQTKNFYSVTEADKDPVSVSVYNRDMAVEERYNIVFKYTDLNGNRDGQDEFLTTLKNSVTMGSDGFDLVVGQNYYCLPVAAEGNLYDLASSPFLHWDEKWYSSKINDNAAIHGKIFGGSGSYIMSQISYAMATFYCKELFEARYPDTDLYEMVREGEWTYEKLYEYTADVYNDTNPNYRRDDNDDFGYVYNGHGIAASVAASETPITSLDDEGKLTVKNYYNDHLVDVFEKYSLFYNDSRGTYKAGTDYGPAELLGRGRTIFACAQLGALHDCADLKNSELHFGVLPMPMLDTDQEEYYTYTMRWELFYIPTNADFERSAIILEYLNYTTEKYVIPAYWDEALTLRAADTDQDSEMMYIVRDALWYDFVTFFNHEIPMRDAVANQISNGSTRFSSWWRTNGDTFEQNLKDTLEKYAAAGGN